MTDTMVVRNRTSFTSYPRDGAYLSTGIGTPLYEPAAWLINAIGLRLEKSWVFAGRMATMPEVRDLVTYARRYNGVPYMVTAEKARAAITANEVLKKKPWLRAYLPMSAAPMPNDQRHTLRFPTPTPNTPPRIEVAERFSGVPLQNFNGAPIWNLHHRRAPAGDRAANLDYWKRVLRQHSDERGFAVESVGEVIPQTRVGVVYIPRNTRKAPRVFGWMTHPEDIHPTNHEALMTTLYRAARDAGIT